MSELIIGTSALANANQDLLNEACIQWIRIDFPFPFQDKLGGELTPEYLNARQQAHTWAAKGFKIMGVTPLIGLGTYRATVEGGMEMIWNDWLPPYMGKPNTDQFLGNYRFVCAFLGDDLKQEVRAWQIANEMNHIQFSGPQKPRQACDLLIYGGLGIKEADPTLLVGWNSCLPVLSYYFYGRIHTHPMNPMDYVGIDAYYGTWDHGSPEDWEKKIIELYELTGAKVMINEWGYSSAGEVMTPEEARQNIPNCALKKWRFAWKGGHTPEIQAEFVQRALMVMANQRQLLLGMFFYRWEDQEACWQCGEADCPVETAWGLVDIHNRPKPAFYAFKEGVRQLIETSRS
uniref:Uncharacterized protein n=1 Tax=Anaerolinea thermolimosa TaxID=229919 RepID=A0A7C4PH79_9CHLR